MSRKTWKCLRKIEKSGFNGITELNLSCPNVPGKPQLAYDFEATYETLKEVFSIFSKPLGIKIASLILILLILIQLADILNQFPLTYVNAINSVGNGLYIDTEQEAVVIKPKRRVRRHWRRVYQADCFWQMFALFIHFLKPEIQIIGTGGIRTGQDAFEHLLCGASMLQIGTELHKRRAGNFSRIIKN